MSNSLEKQQDTSRDADGTFAPDPRAGAKPRNNGSAQPRNPATGQYASPDAPAVRERVNALVVELRTASGLPAALADALRLELGSLVVAIGQLADRLGGQLLTPHGRLRATARTRQRLIERAVTIAGQLGLEASASDRGKPRPWSKLTRREQEAEAARALEEVERNLRGSSLETQVDEDHEQ